MGRLSLQTMQEGPRCLKTAAVIHRHFVIVIGRLDKNGYVNVGSWKFENWHLYRMREHRAVKKPDLKWRTWDRIF